VLMLDPEGVVRNVGPTVIVGVGKATVARESERKIYEAVLTGDPPIAMVADRQIFDDQFQLAIYAAHLPNLLAVFGNVGLPVFRTVANLIHHSLECAFADLAHELAGLVEYLDMRRIDLVCLRATQQDTRDRDPEIAVLVDGCGRWSVQPGLEDLNLV